MFTTEERNRVRESLLAMARADNRVVAGAEVGASAQGGGDRWSDLDLAFGLGDGARAVDVFGDWTADLGEIYGAVQLFDLPFASSLFRVFLFPGCLQVDLSLTPGASFGALGPKFKLLFGSATEGHTPTPSTAAHLFGLAAHHAVRARISIERDRVWQAEYWISGLRDQALSLACRLRGLPAEGRGFDDLPPELLGRFKPAIVRSLDRGELLRALGAAVDGLLEVARDDDPRAAAIAAQLRVLATHE
jgi:hypothetical protein